MKKLLFLAMLCMCTPGLRAQHHSPGLQISLQSFEQQDWSGPLTIDLSLVVLDSITFTDSANCSQPGIPIGR